MQLRQEPGDASVDRVERELTRLTRRVQKVQLHTQQGLRPLERALYSILRQLQEQGPLRSGVVAAELHLDPSTVSRHVAALVEAGMVAREVDPDDGRAFRLRLTPEGERSLTATRRARQRLLREVLEAWSPEERAALGELLQKFNLGLEERLAAAAPQAPGPPSSRPPVTTPAHVMENATRS